MKSLSDIKQLLKEIKDEPIYYRDQNKKKWYKIEKYLLNENKLVMHKKTQIVAQRIYQYYLKIKGDWDESSFENKKVEIFGSSQGMKRNREGNPVDILNFKPRLHDGRSYR